MTIKQFAADAWGDVTRGWGLTLSKWSVQINTAEAFVMGLLSTMGDVLPLWALPVAYVVFKVVGMIASNLTQKDIGTYDKRTHRLVQIVKRTASDE